MSEVQLTIEDAVIPVNSRFVVVASIGEGLYAYQLYVEGEQMKTLVLDTMLSQEEVTELSREQVDVEMHPNRVFLRSLAHLPTSSKTR